MLSIKVDDLVKLKTPNIIDIRSEQSYNNNHLPNAKNMPLEKLLKNFKTYLNKNNTYYIYCQKGKNSIKVCQILSNWGYKVINISGGYEAWLLNN